MKLTRTVYDTIKNIVDTYDSKEGAIVISKKFKINRDYAYRLYNDVKYNKIGVME